jgi:flagellar hook protein FlgE
MSGMAVATARMARSAYNVANVNTPRFQPVREVTQEGPIASGPRSTPTQPSAQASAQFGESFSVHNFQGQTVGGNTDLAFEAIDQINAVHAFRANVAMLQADDERYGSLLNIKA